MGICQVLEIITPLSLNISRYILLTVLYTFLMIIVGNVLKHEDILTLATGP